MYLYLPIRLIAATAVATPAVVLQVTVILLSGGHMLKQRLEKWVLYGFCMTLFFDGIFHWNQVH